MLQNGRGGGEQEKFHPYKKGGRKSFSHVEGGGEHKKFSGSFNAAKTRFSHSDGGGGAKSLHPLKGGTKSCTLS